MITIAQLGVKHGHAAGKTIALRHNSQVSFVGIYEPDDAARHDAQLLSAYAGVPFFDQIEAILDNPHIQAVAIEGSNWESLAMAQHAASAGKHLWLDKPAGDDWPAFQRLIATVTQHHLHLQLGYMFRYHHGFNLIAQLAHDGILGNIFTIRGNMSTNITASANSFTATSRRHLATHCGGIFYDLAGHLIDQIVWLLGRPSAVHAFLRTDASPDLPSFIDNALGVFSFPTGLAFVDVAAMVPLPSQRRFEVYGTRGSAILHPLEPATHLTLTLTTPAATYPHGSTTIPIPSQNRQDLYDAELAAFLRTITKSTPPDRPLAHEILVQETLLRATGALPTT